MNAFPLDYGRYGLSALLIAAIAGCALWIGYAAGWGARAPLTGLQPAVQTARMEEIRLAPEYAPLGTDRDLAETTARPLFNASRRPLPGTAQAGSAGAITLQDGRYALTGVSISPQAHVALLREIATNKTWRVEQNKELNGMVLESVTPTSVTLKLGAERMEIPLKLAPAAKPAAVSAAKPDQDAGATAAAGASSPVKQSPMPAPPAAAAVPGMPKAAADIANADPITEADVAERAARVQARRNRQLGAGQPATR
jgi:hypothetical protein